MTKETLASLAAELETCGQTLLKIAEALQAKEKAPHPGTSKARTCLPELHLGRSAEGGGG